MCGLCNKTIALEVALVIHYRWIFRCHSNTGLPASLDHGLVACRAKYPLSRRMPVTPPLLFPRSKRGQKPIQRGYNFIAASGQIGHRFAELAFGNTGEHNVALTRDVEKRHQRLVRSPAIVDAGHRGTTTRVVKLAKRQL